jgi:hypothetical protein
MSANARSDNEQHDAGPQLAVAGEVSVRPSIGSPPLVSSRRRNLAICLLLAVATFALYSPAIGHPFIFEYDDSCYVINNSHVQAGVAWKTIAWALASMRCGNWHPLTWLSHALDCQLFGMNPHGHHVTNVLLHVLNVVLLFLLLAWATGALGRSALVAALFASHPFNVESVVWIAERKNVLSTLFFLLALGAYGWYARKPNAKRYLTVAALFVLGLASKPMVITLPFVLLLLDFWPLGRIQGWSSPSRPGLGNDDKDSLSISPGPAIAFQVPQFRFSRLVLEKLPLLAFSAAAAVVTILAQRSHKFMHLELPVTVRLENAIYAYAMYVWKAFWPARLTVFYPHPWDTLALCRIGSAILALRERVGMAAAQRPALPDHGMALVSRHSGPSDWAHPGR